LSNLHSVLKFQDAIINNSAVTASNFHYVISTQAVGICLPISDHKDMDQQLKQERTLENTASITSKWTQHNASARASQGVEQLGPSMNTQNHHSTSPAGNTTHLK
jgi:hypothetical protein